MHLQYLAAGAGRLFSCTLHVRMPWQSHKPNLVATSAVSLQNCSYGAVLCAKLLVPSRVARLLHVIMKKSAPTTNNPIIYRLAPASTSAIEALPTRVEPAAVLHTCANHKGH